MRIYEKSSALRPIIPNLEAMKWRFLNSVSKRIGFAFGITALLIMIDILFREGKFFSLYYVIFGSVLAYIPITVFYAAVSTFFQEDESKSDDVIDD